MPTEVIEHTGRNLVREGLSEQKFHKSTPLGTKQIDFENRIMEGFSAGIGNEDQGRDIILPGAFQKTIAERVANKNVKLLDQHSPRTTSNVWGVVVEAEERALSEEQKRAVAAELGVEVGEAPTHRLWSKFLMSEKERAQEALQDIEDGILNGLSIGFRTVRVEFVADEDVDLQQEGIDAEIAWLRGRGVRKVHELAWWETSIVVWPMNRAAKPIPSSLMDTLSSVTELSDGDDTPTEKEVRYAIRSLEKMVGDDPEQINQEDFSHEALKGVSERLDSVIETIEKEATVPKDAREALTDLYGTFKERREDAVTGQDFVAWVEDEITDTGGKETEEEVEEKDEEVFYPVGHEEKVLSGVREASEIEWASTTPADDAPAWSDVDLTFDAFLDGYFSHTDAGRPDEEINSWEDAPQTAKDWMAARTIKGDPDADDFENGVSFPVVNPATDNLEEPGVQAANSRAGAEDMSDVQRVAENLMEEHFPDEEDATEGPQEENEAEITQMNEKDELIDVLMELSDQLTRITDIDQPDEPDSVSSDEEEKDTSDEEEEDSAPSEDEEVAGASEQADEDGRSESGKGRSDEHFEDEDEAAQAALAWLELHELEE